MATKRLVTWTLTLGSYEFCFQNIRDGGRLKNFGVGGGGTSSSYIGAYCLFLHANHSTQPTYVCNTKERLKGKYEVLYSVFRESRSGSTEKTPSKIKTNCQIEKIALKRCLHTL